MPVIRSSVYGWRCPRIRSQPSSCVRKCQSLRRLPCETTSARTLAPETSGAPSFTSAPSPTSNTSRSNLAPTSWASFSTLRRSPSLTRYCFPLVLTTAYIGDLLAIRLGTGPVGREVMPPGAERHGRCGGSQSWRLALAPARGAQIDCARGGGNEEGNLGGLGCQGERISPDLVRCVAVAGDPVGADHHAADPAAREQRSGRRIRQQRDGNAVLEQLPG